MITGTPLSEEDAIALIGEGVHTGLRKGTNAPSSAKLWKAIADSDDSAWEDAVGYFYWRLKNMGYDIVEVGG